MTIAVPDPRKMQPIDASVAAPAPLVDPFGRAIRYLRVSVTDRCDFRCVYCMSPDMTFLPKRDLLTLDELDRLCSTFVDLGTRRIRITGGEPLMRRDVMTLFRSLSRHLDSSRLEEITLTTNGSKLAQHAADLVQCGVKRINVSLDTRDPVKFRSITRRGDLDLVLAGLDAALKSGLSVKINMLALKDVNEDEIIPMIEWAHGGGMDISLIEIMPLGEIGVHRADQYLPLDQVKKRLREHFTFENSAYRTGGPAHYVHVRETGGRLGFITPLTHNFCETCNRVRVTCTGTLYMCLGQEDAVDLGKPLRSGSSDDGLQQAICAAIARKPKGHAFVIDRAIPQLSVSRHMSRTGG